MHYRCFFKLIETLRKVKLGKRLIFTLVFIFVFTVIIVGLMLFTTSTNTVMKKTKQYLSDYIVQLQTNIDKYMDNNINYLNEVSTSVKIINFVRDYEKKNEDNKISSGPMEIYNEILTVNSTLPGLIGIEISTLTDLIVSGSPYSITTGNISSSSIMKSIAENSDRLSFLGTIPLERTGVYSYTKENGKGVVIGAKIKNHSNGKPVGMAVMAFSESSMYNEIYNVSFAGIDEVYITDKNGLIISAKDKNLIGQNDNPLITNTIIENERTAAADNQYRNFNIKINDVNYLVYYSTSLKTGWRIISLTNSDKLVSDISKNFRTSLIIFVITTFLVFLLAVFITQSITLPLKNIIKAMRKTSVNSYPEVAVTGNDEITYLGKTFNQMSQRIQSLIDEIKLMNKKEKQAQFKALQSQINPHFLYNTLDSVNWLGYLSGNDDICQIVNSLSKFFRLSLNKGNDFYSISDELEHVKSYINIQKIKYKSHIEFVFDIENTCLKYKTLKILLQPLVENSICHGIEPLGGKGIIEIKIYSKNNVIKMVVSDNGIGINKQPLEVLKDSFKNDSLSKGYGLANIDERIKLYFGAEFGVHIENNQESGTKVTITIPIIDCDKGTDNNGINNH